MIQRRSILRALAALPLLPTLAQAHGPTRQKLTLSVVINAPPAKVWAVIGNFHDLSWDPLVAKVEGDGGNTENATRTITFKDGRVIEGEQLTHYDADEMSYGTFLPHVDVKVLPVADYSANLMVIAADGGKSKVEWRAAFYRGFPNNDPPPALNEEAAIKAVTAMAQPALDALKAKLEGGT
jgi:hypothetical protein